MFFQEEKKFNFEDERNSRWPWQTTQGLWARVWTHFAYSEENKHISKLNRKSKWLHYFFFLIPIFHTRSNGKRTAAARPWLNPAARLRLFLKVDVDSGLNPVEQGWEEAAGGQPQPTAVSLTFHYHAVISVEMSGEGGRGGGGGGGHNTRTWLSSDGCQRNLWKAERGLVSTCVSWHTLGSSPVMSAVEEAGAASVVKIRLFFFYSVGTRRVLRVLMYLLNLRKTKKRRRCVNKMFI